MSSNYPISDNSSSASLAIIKNPALPEQNYDPFDFKDEYYQARRTNYATYVKTMLQSLNLEAVRKLRKTKNSPMCSDDELEIFCMSLKILMKSYSGIRKGDRMLEGPSGDCSTS